MLIEILISNWNDLGSQLSLRLSLQNVRKILVGHEPLPRKWDGRHSRPTYLLRQDLWNAPPPSASTGIRAWKDVPAWPVDTQDNARIKKRRRRNGVCYFWIKYGRDIKALESDLWAKTLFRCVSKVQYIFPSDSLSKSPDIICSVIRSEIKHKESPKVILNSRKECLYTAIIERWRIEVHSFSRNFHHSFYMR